MAGSFIDSTLKRFGRCLMAPLVQRCRCSTLISCLLVAALLGPSTISFAEAKCNQCQDKWSLWGGYTCVPRPDCILPVLRENWTQVQACLADVLGCAQTQLAKIMPDLDTQVCETQKSKDREIAGGWSVYYGPRVWDTKVGAQNSAVGLLSC